MCNIDTSNFEFYSQNFTTTHSDSSLKYITYTLFSFKHSSDCFAKKNARVFFANSGRFVFLPKKFWYDSNFSKKRLISNSDFCKIVILKTNIMEVFYIEFD